MGAVETSYTFTATDTITSAKMNDIIDQTIMTSTAISGDTLQVTSSGRLAINSQGVTSNEMAANSITSTQIVAGAVTTEKLASNAIAYKAQTLANGGNQDGSPMTFHYADLGGQPTYVWGSNDGNNHYVYNRANFSVNYATRAENGPENGTFTQNHTANTNRIYVGGFGSGTGNGIWCQRAANTNATAITFHDQNGTQRGSIVIDTAPSTNYNSSSDYRLKEDYQVIINPLEKINKLKPINFKWVDFDTRIDGFLAHEVNEVVPNAITGEKDAVDQNNDPIYQQIDQSKLIPIMVAAIQELSRKVSEFESR